MTFQVKPSSIYRRHLGNLKTRFNLSDSDTREVLSEIRTATELLKIHGEIPEEYGYEAHELKDRPWIGHMEFHVADDILVVYYDRIDSGIIRLVGIYDHETLRTGKLD